MRTTRSRLWTTPASVNLIEGKRDQVIDLLDALAYGGTAEAEIMQQRKKAWRKKMIKGDEATRVYYAGKSEEDQK